MGTYAWCIFVVHYEARGIILNDGSETSKPIRLELIIRDSPALGPSSSIIFRKIYTPNPDILSPDQTASFAIPVSCDEYYLPGTKVWFDVKPMYLQESEG